MHRWIWSLFLIFALGLPSASWAKEAQFNFIYTGATRGLASDYFYQLQRPYPLFLAHLLEQQVAIENFEVKQTQPFFHQNGHIIWGEHLDIPRFHTWLAEEGPSQTPESEHSLTILDTPDAISLEPSQTHQFIEQLSSSLKQYPMLKPFAFKAATLRVYKEGIHILSPGDANVSGLSTRPYFWEIILGSALQIETDRSHVPIQLFSLGKPMGEGSRRARLIQNIRGPQDLLVDGGNILEGLSSVKAQQLSLQRQNSLKLIQELGYDAIAVGREELRGGLDNLLAEQKTYQLPLISANLYREGAPVFPPYKLMNKGDTTLALIGLSHSDDLNSLKERGWIPEDITILDTHTALQKSISALEAELGKRPDMLVLLSNLSDQNLEALSHENRDFHLILADNSAPFLKRVNSQTGSLERRPHPFLVSSNPHALNRTALKLTDKQLQIHSEILPVTFDMAIEPHVMANLMEVRHNAYLNAFDPLIPNLQSLILNSPSLEQLFLNSESVQQAHKEIAHTLPPAFQEHKTKIYPPVLTKELLANLELNALIELFETEVAILYLSDKMELNIPGALPRMLVYELLRTDDRLELFYLTGKQIKDVYGLPQSRLVLGGLNGDGSKIRNRPLDPKKVYKTLMPSSVSSMSAVKGILKNSRKKELLFNPFAPNTPPERIYLRSVLLQFFESLSQERDYAEQLAYLLEPRWNQRQNLFSFDLDDFQLNISGYNALNNQAYAAVRETRVTSPDSYTFGGRGKLTLGFDNEPLGFLNSVQAKFEGLSVIEAGLENFTENQDDLLFASELQLHIFEFPFLGTPVDLSPFLEGNYDTEFTPTVNAETDLLNPLQSELNGIVGLQIPAGIQLKKFKSGLAVRRDFNVPNNLELGMIFQFQHEWPLTDYLIWSNDLDFKYYFPSPNDNETSLGLISKWVSGIKVPLTENLALKFYADAYLFRGKLPTTSDLGASVILGVGLNYDRFWKPWYEWG